MRFSFETWGPLSLVLLLVSGCGEDLALGKGVADAEIDAAVRSTDGAEEDASVVGDATVDAIPSTDVREDTSTHQGPPYPIVLAHGFAGFEHLADVEVLEYYYGVKEALEKNGEVVVIGKVDPFNDSTDRGEQLIDQIETFVENSPYRQVNIIGHSQGGLDARYAAHHRPHHVASVVTISAPHGGTEISDIVLQLIDHKLVRDVIDEVVKLFGKALYDKAGEETSLVEGLRQFSDPGIEKFNEEITDKRGVYYASVAGRTDGHLGEKYCEYDSAPDFVKKWKSVGDPVDPFLSLTEEVIDGSGSRDRPNDGLVRVSDAKWGEFLGCIPADHLDEVGQLVGDEPGGDNDWDHVEFYRKLAEYLHSQGY